MSQYTFQPAAARAPGTNAMGVAGFVCSLVGLIFTLGILCPVGLILSLIGLGRKPRGFAVAGVVLGLIGTCGGLLLLLVGGAAILAALGIAAATIALSEPEKMEITTDMANMALSIKAYERQNRSLPATLDELDVRPTIRTDPWGNAYEYHLLDEPPGFDLVSAGKDQTFGTIDDARFTSLDEAWATTGLGIDVQEDDDGGTVTIKLGGRTIVAEGHAEEGRVSIDLGDRVIEIVGDDTGGRVNVVPAEPDEDDPDAEDTAPVAAEEEPGR
jgi:hypothetical protein